MKLKMLIKRVLILNCFWWLLGYELRPLPRDCLWLWIVCRCNHVMKWEVYFSWLYNKTSYASFLLSYFGYKTLLYLTPLECKTRFHPHHVMYICKLLGYFKFWCMSESMRYPWRSYLSNHCTTEESFLIGGSTWYPLKTWCQNI